MPERPQSSRQSAKARPSSAIARPQSARGPQPAAGGHTGGAGYWQNAPGTDPSLSHYRLVRHLEMQPTNMKPSQVVITIEHCTDCAGHPTTTRHDESKYVDMSQRLTSHIQDAFPFIEVHSKPTKLLCIKESPCGMDGILSWTMGRPGSVMGKWPREQPSVTGIPGLPTPRLGAFEVQMAVWQMGEQHPNVYILHSKLFTYRWPQMMAVVKAIAERLPAKQLKVTVQVFDYEDGVPKEIPAPEGMVLTAAAGARVETTALVRDEEQGRPPVALVEVPLGCTQITCSATDSTLENSADIDAALSQDGSEYGQLLLRIPIHTAPMFRCVIKVNPEGTFNRDFALITATKPLPGSGWKAESHITESGEAWLFPPSDFAHVECLDLQLDLTVGQGCGKWQRTERREVHMFGTTNMLVEFPAILELEFNPVTAETDENIPQSEAKLVGHNGTAVTDRDWTPAGHKYYLEPGNYKALLRAPGHFEIAHTFTVKMGAAASVPVIMRQKLTKHLGKEAAEVDSAPNAMADDWTPTRGAGEVDIAFLVEESETMKSGVTALVRQLGGGGGNSEVVQFVSELAQCTSVQMAVVTYKGISAESIAVEKVEKADEVEKMKAKKAAEKRLAELKLDATTTRMPLTNNWAGLKVGVQSVDPSCGRDDSHYGLAEGLKTAANSLPWRVAAARLVVVVADCSPADRTDKDALSLKQVHSGAAAPETHLGNLPESLHEAVVNLRSHGISVCACMVAGAAGENNTGDPFVDLTSARGFQAVVAETGGSMACVTSKGVGYNIVFTAAADIALHMQILEDYCLVEPFKSRVEPFMEAGSSSNDEASLQVELFQCFTAVAKKMNDAGLMARTLLYHCETEKAQVMCIPVRASHVSAALRNHSVKGTAAFKPEVLALLNKTAAAQWDKFF